MNKKLEVKKFLRHNVTTTIYVGNLQNLKALQQVNKLKPQNQRKVLTLGTNHCSLANTLNEKLRGGCLVISFQGSPIGGFPGS